MQIFEITSKVIQEKVLQGVNTDIKLPTPTVNPLPRTSGYSSTTGNAPGWNYAGASAIPGAAAPAAPAAPTTPAAPAAPATPIGQQPDIGLVDRAKVAAANAGRTAARIPGQIGAAANIIGGKILSAAGLPADAGMGSKNPFGDKEAQARKAAAPLVKTQADQLYRQWAEASKKTAPNTPAMQQSLDSIIKNTLMRGKPLETLGRYISTEKSNDVAAQLKAIQQSKQNLFSKNAQQTYQDWFNLVNAASELNHLSAFWPAAYTGIEMRKDGKFYNRGQALNLNDPADLKMLQTAMANNEVRMSADADINAVNKQVQNAAAAGSSPGGQQQQGKI
jgi:hypothetical protein